MSESGTKSLRKPLRFWGWGYADEDLHPEEHAMIETVTKMLVPEGLVEIEPPKVEDFDLPASQTSFPLRTTTAWCTATGSPTPTWPGC